MRIPAALFLACSLAAGQTALEPPRIGCFRDPAGRLRPISGIAGVFLAGEPFSDSVLSAACDGRRTLLKTRDTLELREGDSVLRWEAPPGPSVLALAANGAVACFAELRECRWLRDEPQVMPLDGEPLAVAWPRAVVRRDDRLWLLEWSVGGAVVERELAGVSAPLALLGDGTLVYADGAALVVREPDGAERRIALASPPGTLEIMGEGWIRAGGVAVRLTEDGPRLYRLPEVGP